MFNLSVRALACVLLTEKMRLLSAVFGGELLFYLAAKAARREFSYRTPVYGVSGFVFTLLVRILVKFCVDWTVVMQFRHPNEVGGLYFTLTLVSTVGIGVFAAFMHGDAVVTKFMLGVYGGLVVSFVLFLWSIESDYVWTYFDTRTR